MIHTYTENEKDTKRVKGRHTHTENEKGTERVKGKHTHTEKDAERVSKILKQRGAYK